MKPNLKETQLRSSEDGEKRAMYDIVCPDGGAGDFIPVLGPAREKDGQCPQEVQSVLQLHQALVTFPPPPPLARPGGPGSQEAADQQLRPDVLEEGGWHQGAAEQGCSGESGAVQNWLAH